MFGRTGLIIFMGRLEFLSEDEQSDQPIYSKSFESVSVMRFRGNGF